MHKNLTLTPTFVLFLALIYIPFLGCATGAGFGRGMVAVFSATGKVIKGAVTGDLISVFKDTITICSDPSTEVDALGTMLGVRFTASPNYDCDTVFAAWVQSNRGESSDLIRIAQKIKQGWTVSLKAQEMVNGQYDVLKMSIRDQPKDQTGFKLTQPTPTSEIDN